jgi:hypothetical protein
MPKNINVIYLEGNSSWEDMATVTLCDHFIATVGTFSNLSYEHQFNTSDTLVL